MTTFPWREGTPDVHGHRGRTGHGVVFREGAKLRIATTVLDGVQLGDSTAVNGCCLTVVAWEPPVDGAAGWWRRTSSTRPTPAPASATSPPAIRSTRSVRSGSWIASAVTSCRATSTWSARSRRPPPISRSDGPGAHPLRRREGFDHRRRWPALTVDDALDDGFTAAPIRTRPTSTTLGVRKVGDAVNLEVDVTAKYVERLLAAHLPDGKSAESPEGNQS